MKRLNDPSENSGDGRAVRPSFLGAAGAILVAVSALTLTLSLPVKVVAQESLSAQVERLQRELTTLQRQVYRGEVPPASAAGPAAGGDLTSTQAARIELRLSQFESELRALTGQVEQFGYRINQVDRRLEGLAADVDRRLQALEQRQQSGATVAGATAGAEQPASAADTGAQADAGGQAAPSSGGQPGTLGVIDKNQLDQFQARQGNVESQAQSGAASGAAASQTAAAAGTLPGGTPQEQYNHAFSLLRQAQYGQAEQALRTFVEQHPEDPLAGNAKYWLGETYYVRGDYQQSAVIFAEAYQQYPDNSKAPDNLLKLGMSLGALGNTGDACGTFAELLKRYPEAAATVLRRAQQEQQRYSCS